MCTGERGATTIKIEKNKVQVRRWPRTPVVCRVESNVSQRKLNEREKVKKAAGEKEKKSAPPRVGGGLSEVRCGERVYVLEKKEKGGGEASDPEGSARDNET